jgi:predicted phage replisome organizer
VRAGVPEVKWIKIVTDIFDNHKIKIIRKMPEGDAIVVTWFQLLCLAGETNDNGLIYITRAVPYTDETLATAFDTPLPVVRLSLETFERLEMIHIYNSFLCVSNWEKYQNIDGLEKIREQTRKRVADYREKQKKISQCNVTVALPVTHGNATEEEVDIDIKNKKEKKQKTALESAIDDFKDFRKKNKKVMTDRAVELLRMKLDKLANDDETKIAILNQSILQGWIGVFELKIEKQQQQTGVFGAFKEVYDSLEDEQNDQT